MRDGGGGDGLNGRLMLDGIFQMLDGAHERGRRGDGGGRGKDGAQKREVGILEDEMKVGAEGGQSVRRWRQKWRIMWNIKTGEWDSGRENGEESGKRGGKKG